MIELTFSPSPVKVTTATMIPAAAVVAATGSTPMAPAASASHVRLGVIQVERSRNDSKKAATVAYSTARNGDRPNAIRITIRNNELKW